MPDRHCYDIFKIFYTEKSQFYGELLAMWSAGVRRGSVSRDIRRLCDPNVRVHSHDVRVYSHDVRVNSRDVRVNSSDVRVHSHDPLHRRRSLPTRRLAPAAEFLRGEVADCRQRSRVERTRGPRGRLQLTARRRPRRTRHSPTLLCGRVAERDAQTRVRAADVRWTVRSAASCLGRSVLAHLPASEAAPSTSRSHRRQPTVSRNVL